MKPIDQYPPELIQRLGTTVDRVLAEEYGIPQSTISIIRNMKGIPPKRTIRHETVPDQIYNLLGKLPDIKVAEKCGVSHNIVRAMRLKYKIPARGNSSKERDPEMIAMFGKVPMKEISKRFDLSYERIRQLHKKHGIKPLKRYTPRNKV